MSHRDGAERARARSKLELRKRMKAVVAALAPEERSARKTRSSAVLAVCRVSTRRQRSCSSCRPLPRKPPTIELFSLAYEMNKTVLCPRVERSQRRLSLHHVADPCAI